jgi:hypothetical protein
MRDLGKTIDYIERGMLRGLDRKATSLPKGMLPKSSIRAWRAPTSEPKPVYPEQVFRRRINPGLLGKERDKDNSMTRLTLTARALKITVPLDVAEIRGLPDPGGQARCQLAITCEGKVYTADIATKALRKAKSTIATSGAENVFAMVQGKLRNNEITECGLVAQVKTPKPSAAAAAAVEVSHG